MSACSLSNSAVGSGDNARDAELPGREVVALGGVQFHGVHVGAREHLADRGIDFAEVRGADEALEHRDVRTVARIEGEAFRVDLEQARIIGGGMRGASWRPAGAGCRSR